MLNAGSINMGFSALTAAKMSVNQAEKLLLKAIQAVGDGDIIGAMMSVKEAEFSAKSGIAVTRAENEVLGTILDILA